MLALVGVAALALAIAGCGGGESELTKAQLIRQGDAICEQAGVEQAKLASEHKGEVVSGNFEAVTAVFVPPMEKELRRLEALSAAPAALTKEIGAILRAIESGTEDAKADYLDLFVKETDPFTLSERLGAEYGPSCAKLMR